MAKLWDKGLKVDSLIESFTAWDDYILDQNLIVYDCIGSIAHAKMLQSIKILTEDEFVKLKEVLNNIINLSFSNSFEIKVEQEDVHTAIENYLTNILGDLGKKIHTARSRNDQVLLDLRLYMRDKLLYIIDLIIEFCRVLLEFADRYKYMPIAGRTHFQKAMVSSVGLLFSAYAESLLDSIELIKGSYELTDQCPLGSAASYGVALNIDRQLTAELLGFEKVQNNVLYVNNSRGKIESIVLSAINQVMIDLSKLSTDLIIFSSPEFGYFEIPNELCLGSSLMPQKKNPCALELVRARSGTVLGYLIQVLTIIRALPSGYNRDFQETKKPLMESFSIVEGSIKICEHTIKNLKINEINCFNSITAEIFATDEALRLVEKGVSFRDAYKQVSLNIESLSNEDPVENIKSKTHLGAPANLGIDINIKRLDKFKEWQMSQKQKLEIAITRLIS